MRDQQIAFNSFAGNVGASAIPEDQCVQSVPDPLLLGHNIRNPVDRQSFRQLETVGANNLSGADPGDHRSPAAKDGATLFKAPWEMKVAISTCNRWHHC